MVSAINFGRLASAELRHYIALPKMGKITDGLFLGGKKKNLQLFKGAGFCIFTLSHSHHFELAYKPHSQLS